MYIKDVLLPEEKEVVKALDQSMPQWHQFQNFKTALYRIRVVMPKA